MCNPPCVHGACVRNNSCSCSAGYVGTSCTNPGGTNHVVLLICLKMCDLFYVPYLNLCLFFFSITVKSKPHPKFLEFSVATVLCLKHLEFILSLKLIKTNSSTLKGGTRHKFVCREQQGIV